MAEDRRKSRGRKRKAGAVSSVSGGSNPKIQIWNPAIHRFKEESTGGFLPDDVVIEILMNLPSGSCIARFRCVCKLWNNRLSYPGSIYNVLFTPNINLTGDSEIAQILIKGAEVGVDSYRTVYSLRSYKVLKPISPIGDVKFYDNKPADIFLWNPATSETKILPPSPFGKAGCSESRLGSGLILFPTTISPAADPRFLETGEETYSSAAPRRRSAAFHPSLSCSPPSPTLQTADALPSRSCTTSRRLPLPQSPPL
ncbi:unnamed protein product [Linum tenue]|uniref:F-box domain-containing protein n=1 Tax=Linum tenue TaxID=586396 RepID=A0AAV0INR5_9ROSI|nr:unnamed protein product [Linum tenue]